ncbi:heparanase-like protein 3 isoform X4 [Phoenix dactylifera]|uniref:Heparanase-like protein 3 isoform X4 n=1 Tax=Phoenix dactylifera TaxID=42345 RepID=A0A8B8ZCT2_PHODC|nr:heparanase-like protein 3 isoform X4 [Phoenix dactylifera]
MVGSLASGRWVELFCGSWASASGHFYGSPASSQWTLLGLLRLLGPARGPPSSMGQLPLRSLTMTSFALRWIGGRRRSVITGLVAGASHPCSIWCFIFSFLQNLSNKILLNAVKEFSPLKLRIGGSLQDKVIYGVDPQQPCTPFVKKKSEMFGFSQGCLPMHRWDELNGFFKKAGAVIIFGLNALNGRVHLPGGSLGGPWNSTNAASFIHYTVNKGYTIHGWELGNELSGSGVGARIGADQYAADVISLKKIIDDIYQGFPHKPLVLAPGGFFDASWFNELIKKTKPHSLDAITHHIYNLGAGVDKHLVDKILNPSYLDGEASTFRNLQGILRSAGTSTTAWVGEAGGAYNSGHHLVTDSFVFSFWYLDQLGMSSTYNTKSYCRQSLVGGNYGLLNTATFHPNPDYYSALLWHRLMGSKVLSTNFTGTKSIRAYAHCARESLGITLLLINLSGKTTSQVFVTTASAFTIALKHHIPRTRFNHITRLGRTLAFMREEYHLTAKDGNLHSQAMLLNGNILSVDSEGNFPTLKPMEVDASLPITLAPFSIVFVHIPHFHAPACG